MGAGFEFEKVSDGAGFGVGRREQIFSGEFVFAEVFFDAKRCDLHREEFGQDGVGASRTKLTLGWVEFEWVSGLAKREARRLAKKASATFKTRHEAPSAHQE